MEVRVFRRIASVFLSLGVACGATESPGGQSAGLSSSSGELEAPDTTATPTTGSTTEIVEPGSTGGTSSTGVGTTAPEPLCGNGELDGNEICDLGEDNSNVGPCTLDCLPATCGDGHLWAGVEECDEGPANSLDYGGCDPDDCTLNARCGDGILHPFKEDCDLGELNGTGDGIEGHAPCSATCSWVGRLVFLSSKAYSGALGGTSGADLKCETLAQAAGLTNPSKYRAWVSDGVHAPGSRFTNLSPSGVPYILRNGKIVAGDFPELIDTGPRTGISITEFGSTVIEKYVWTNTSAKGEIFSPNNHCAEWTSSSALALARIGYNAVPIEQGPDWDAWRNERRWTSFLGLGCNEFAHLYCVEDGED
jgi:hypothetical protein